MSNPFLIRLKQSLPLPAYNLFKRTIQKYQKAEITIQQVLASVEALIEIPGTVWIVEEFGKVCPEEGKVGWGKVRNRWKRIRGQQEEGRMHQGSSADSRMTSVLKRRRSDDVDLARKRRGVIIVQEPVSNIVEAPVIKKKKTCIVCMRDVVHPFKAKCDHEACWQCWKVTLKKQAECPDCGEYTRRRFLRKVCFS